MKKLLLLFAISFSLGLTSHPESGMNLPQNVFDITKCCGAVADAVAYSGCDANGENCSVNGSGTDNRPFIQAAIDAACVLDEPAKVRVPKGYYRVGSSDGFYAGTVNVDCDDLTIEMDGYLMPYAGITKGQLLMTICQASSDHSCLGTEYFKSSGVSGNTITSQESDGATPRSHGFISGDGPMRLHTQTGGTLPTPLAEGTNYWIIYKTDSTYQFASSYANAIAGTPVTLSDTGGTVWNSVEPQDTIENVTLKGHGGIYSDNDRLYCTWALNGGGNCPGEYCCTWEEVHYVFTQDADRTHVDGLTLLAGGDELLDFTWTTNTLIENLDVSGSDLSNTPVAISRGNSYLTVRNNRFESGDGQTGLASFIHLEGFQGYGEIDSTHDVKIYGNTFMDPEQTTYTDGLAYVDFSDDPNRVQISGGPADLTVYLAANTFWYSKFDTRPPWELAWDEITAVGTDYFDLSNNLIADWPSELASGINLTFADTDPDTITAASGTPFADVVNDTSVRVTDSVNNNGTFLVASHTDTVLTLDAAETLTAEGPVAAKIYLEGVAWTALDTRSTYHHALLFQFLNGMQIYNITFGPNNTIDLINPNSGTCLGCTIYGGGSDRDFDNVSIVDNASLEGGVNLGSVGHLRISGNKTWHTVGELVRATDGHTTISDNVAYGEGKTAVNPVMADTETDGLLVLQDNEFYDFGGMHASPAIGVLSSADIDGNSRARIEYLGNTIRPPALAYNSANSWGALNCGDYDVSNDTVSSLVQGNYIEGSRDLTSPASPAVVTACDVVVDNTIVCPPTYGYGILLRSKENDVPASGWDNSARQTHDVERNRIIGCQIGILLGDDIADANIIGNSFYGASSRAVDTQTPGSGTDHTGTLCKDNTSMDITGGTGGAAFDCDEGDTPGTEVNNKAK